MKSFRIKGKIKNEVGKNKKTIEIEERPWIVNALLIEHET